MKKPRKLVYRLRTNEVESDLLQARAAAAGMKPTAYIRSKVFPKATKKNVATIVASEKNTKLKVYKTPAEAREDFKPSPATIKKADQAYRRFAEPGELLKK